MLAAGEPLMAILASFCGTDSGGRAWVDRFWAVLEAACDTSVSRRKCLELWLRTFEHARRHGSQWRVVTHHSFVGHCSTWRDDVRIDEDGCVEPVKRREHVRANPRVGYGAAGGLSARMRRSPRHLNRYRRMLKAGRIMCSQRTTRHHSDAVLPHPDAHWGYAQLWLGMEPSAEMRRRWTGYRPPRFDRTQPRSAPRTPATAHEGTNARERAPGPSKPRTDA